MEKQLDLQERWSSFIYPGFGVPGLMFHIVREKQISTGNEKQFVKQVE